MKNLIFIAVALMACSCKPETKAPGAQPAEMTPIEAAYISPDAFKQMNLPFSQVVKYGNVLYLSGQLGNLPGTTELVEGGIGPETIQTMENIKAVLKANNSSMDQVIKCTCMLADMADWPAMNAEYSKFFPNNKPARSALGASGLALDARVEIECMAYVE
ncbi:MAG: RidA family protein [Cyclobacteriaceae bacterium]